MMLCLVCLVILFVFVSRFVVLVGVIVRCCIWVVLMVLLVSIVCCCCWLFGCFVSVFWRCCLSCICGVLMNLNMWCWKSVCNWWWGFFIIGCLGFIINFCFVRSRIFIVVVCIFFLFGWMMNWCWMRFVLLIMLVVVIWWKIIVCMICVLIRGLMFILWRLLLFWFLVVFILVIC